MRPRQRLCAPARVVAALAFALLGCADNPIDLFPPSQGADDAASAAHDAASLAQGEGGGAFRCLSDNDCTSSDAPRCEPASQMCVECVGGDNDCSGRSRSTCNRMTDQCAFPCTSNADCPSDDVCDLSQDACVECLNSSQCGDPEPLCVHEKCVECESDKDCASGTQCWQSACVACVTSADCPDGEGCSTRHACR